MMKIAVVGTRGFPGVQGGVERHCEHLYARLAEKGCDVTVFTRKPYVTPDLHAYKGMSLVCVSCPKNKYLETIVHTFKCVLRARKLKPDILHIHAIGPSVFTPLARVFGMKVVVTTQGPDYERIKWNPAAKLFLKFCERIGIGFSNEVIAVSESIAEEIKLRYNRDVAVIPNGVEVSAVADSDDTLKKLGVKRNRYILAVGRLVPEKGFDYLIDAFSELQSDVWKLVIVGSADHEDKYSLNLREKAEKNNKIILTGFLTGLPLHELYTHAGLFVLPSCYEGLPIVLLEAMSYGLSCIASDIPANKNIEINKDRYFEAGDVKSLASKIKEFIKKPLDEYNRGRQIDMIDEKYNWNRIVNDTLKVYERIIR